MTGPGQVFGKRLGLIALDQLRESCKVLAVQRTFSANRQADAMQRQRILLADQSQEVMERAASDHVVFSVNFEETEVGPGTEHFTKVLGLEPQSGAARQPGRRSLSVGMYAAQR